MARHSLLRDVSTGQRNVVTQGHRAWCIAVQEVAPAVP